MAIGQTKLHEMLSKGNDISEEKSWIFAWNEDFIVAVLDFIKYDQLFDTGKDGKGRPLGWYSERTEQINPLKKAGTHYTLHDTGEFYESMNISVFDDSIEITADGRKVDDDGNEIDILVEWGSDVIALNEENLGKAIDEIKEKYIQYVRQLLLRD